MRMLRARSLLRFSLAFSLFISLGLSLYLWATDRVYLIKGVRATYLRGISSPAIDDYPYWDLATVEAGQAQPHYRASDFGKKSLPDDLLRELEANRTTAFLVFRHDSLLFERYWDGYGPDSASNPFSASKTITVLLVEKAIELGLLKSWEQAVVDILPELKGEYSGDLKLKHLATMSAGLNWDEDYESPFTLTARTYYTSRLDRDMLKYVSVTEPPGKKYEYQSGSTQLLGMCVRKASGRSLSDFASEHFWKPLGAEQPAHWQLDRSGGSEIAYCCFNTNASDLARFALLSAQKGLWRGHRLLDSAFFEKATRGDLVSHYGYSYWIDAQGSEHEVFCMRGKNGQYAAVLPAQNLVFVRLGWTQAPAGEAPHSPFFLNLRDRVIQIWGNGSR